MGVLEGRVAIVTGACGGIGKGCAIKYAEAGASLLVSDINEQGLNELVAELKAINPKVVSVVADVAKEEDLDKIVSTCVNSFGKVDILANIAQGGMGDMTYLEDATTERALLSYVTGPLQSMILMQKCFPYMKNNGYGRIINIASGSTIVGEPGFSAYQMAKGAVMALTRNAAKEWGKYGIVTNCILPAIKTPAYDLSEQGQAVAERLKAQIPVGYFGTPYEDCAPILTYLASEGAGYINGQFLGVDGGMTLIA